MNQLIDIAGSYARLLQDVRDASEDCLGVIAARRQDLASDKGSIGSKEDEVGKGAADIDPEAARKFSIAMRSWPSPKVPVTRIGLTSAPAA